ncbi:fibrinogen-like protein 1 [Ptychodera flava]|uniref:fibrinogen-like protein 1 n=1 Tax=Ptychodera flava TaxID=63121 RepID=UPI00396A38EC
MPVFILIRATLLYNLAVLIGTPTEVAASLVESAQKRCVFRFNVLEEHFASCHSDELENRVEKLVEEVTALRLAVSRIVSDGPKEKDSRYLDCQDVFNAGLTSKGQYTIWPATSPKPISVYCEMDDGKGWTVFQRRLDGSVDFNRLWLGYKEGFGDLSAEHWLGNDNLFYLTSGKRSYELCIVVTDWSGKSFTAVYSDFKVGGPTSMYKLTLGEFMGGSAGDSLLHISSKFKVHHGQQFSTEDMDNDSHSGNCAQVYHSGWWFSSCFTSNLNGVYQSSSVLNEDWNGIIWSTLNGHYSYKSSVMKIRPSEIK